MTLPGTGIARSIGAALSANLAGPLVATASLAALPFLIGGGLKIVYDILLWLAFRAEPGAALFGGSFVQDELAIFAKRLFLLATILGVLASLSLRAPTFARRATEYYVAMLVSLLGMLVLASARELILLFVAFELMSIPLYVISGFRKREEEAVEAALKFFLIGTVSSAFIVYGLSFVYGITRTTDMGELAQAMARALDHRTSPSSPA